MTTVLASFATGRLILMEKNCELQSIHPWRRLPRAALLFEFCGDRQHNFFWPPPSDNLDADGQALVGWHHQSLLGRGRVGMVMESITIIDRVLRTRAHFRNYPGLPMNIVVGRGWVMPGGQLKTNIDDAVSNEDWSALVQLARQEPAKTLRYLTSRLCSADAPLKWKAVRALAAVAGDREGMGENRIRRLLQRFLWLLTDESGNVPYGVPEAFGEVLVARPEFQAEFLPLLCSLAYDPERIQTGPIEQGVFWALGRVGQPAAACSPEAVEAVDRASRQHPEPETRSIANWARSRF